MNIDINGIKKSVLDEGLLQEWMSLGELSDNAVFRKILNTDCLILRSAEKAFDDRDRSRLKDFCDATSTLKDASPRQTRQSLQVKSRLALIEALAGNLEKGRSEELCISSLRTSIEGMVQAYQETWHWQAQYRELAGVEQSPAAFKMLEKGTQDVFQSVAENLNDGWANPGLQMALETANALFGSESTADASVKTWVLFAGRDKEGPFPLCAQLTMERLPNGSGLLVPSSRHAAYLLLDSSFQLGLQNALLAVRARYGDIPEYDWRWSLSRLTTETGPNPSVVDIPLCGQSASAAFACAMLALDSEKYKDDGGHDLLDPHVAITAMFDPSGVKEGKLAGVKSIDIKTMGGELERLQIRDVVIAKGQDPNELPTSAYSNFDDRAKNLDEAYELLSRWSRITRKVKKKIVEASDKLLDHEKMLGPESANPEEDGYRYVQSPLRQVFPHLRQPVEDVESLKDSEPKHDLNDKELKQFELASWIPWVAPDEAPVQENFNEVAPRIWLHADSGYGKSVLMAMMERNIAAAPGTKIPLRLGKSLENHGSLSEFNWRDDRDAVLRVIFERLFEGHLLGTPDESLGWEWFCRVVNKQADAVFLLDGLDTTNELGGLGRFLNDDPQLRRCVVVIAGRHEALSRRREAFLSDKGVSWAHVRVQPWTKESQKKFVGRRSILELFPPKPTISNYQTTDFMLLDDEDQEKAEKFHRRKYLWEDLTGTPLLLKLLRDLSRSSSGQTSKLADISNRYDLYAKVIDQLIDKGKSTLTQVSGSERELLVDQLDEVLGDIAWFAMSRGRLSGFVTGEEFKKIMGKYGNKKKYPNLMPRLYQLNLITDLFDSYGELGMEWRHRSYCEYFAGRYLVMQTEQNRNSLRSPLVPCVAESERLEVLEDVHRFDASAPNSDLSLSWEWAFRFALCHANQGSASGITIKADTLALELIRFGNPWVVYEAIEKDGVQFRLPEPEDSNVEWVDAEISPVEELTRWLVDRVSGYEKNQRYNHVYNGSNMDRYRLKNKNLLTLWTSRCLDFANEMLHPDFRDAPFISPLLELNHAASMLDTIGESMSFLATGATSEARAQFTVPEVYLHSPDYGILDKFIDSFVELPAGKFLTADFPGPSDPVRTSRPLAEFNMPEGQRISRFFVTHRVFEAFSPKHGWLRSQVDDEPDQPCDQVSKITAQAFCDWLTRRTKKSQGGRFRLPTEWEFEWAVRWGGQYADKYWWGPEFDPQMLWFGGKKTTRTEEESKTAHGETMEHAGLIDPVGNVWCYCESPEERDCILRGVGCDVLNETRAEVSSCKNIRYDGAITLWRYTGFRVLWEPLN